MEELLSSIDQKLDWVIYCLIGFLVLSAIRTFFVATGHIQANWKNREADYYGDLFRKEKYQELLKHLDKALEKDSRSLYPVWYKAKTLYQLEQYEEAGELFDRVQTIEPDWMDNAQSYLDRINKLELALEKHRRSGEKV